MSQIKETVYTGIQGGGLKNLDVEFFGIVKIMPDQL